MDDAAAEPAVLTRVDDGTLVVTLNRPRVRNAVDHAMAAGVAAALDRADADPGITAVVLAAEGPDFCSGMDLRAFERGEIPDIEGRGFAGIVERSSTKPVIAAVEGRALAGGFEIVLACDLVVAARTATFALPEVRRGLVPAAGGLVRLPRRIPSAVALELVVTGDAVDAGRLHALGLVNRLTDEGGALEEALGFAAAIARNAPLAVATAKRVIVEQADWPASEVWDRQRADTARVQTSVDAREGAVAFLEKRDPVWQGC